MFNNLKNLKDIKVTYITLRGWQALIDPLRENLKLYSLSFWGHNLCQKFENCYKYKTKLRNILKTNKLKIFVRTELELN